MKKFVLALSSSLLIFTAFGQLNKAAIEQQFLVYTHLLMNKSFSKSIDYLNEDFLKIIPKEQLVILMEKTYNNPDLEFNISEPKVLKVDSIKKIGNQYYAKLQYSNMLQMKFKFESAVNKSEEDRSLKDSLTLKALEKNFGSGNVAYNIATHFYEIYVEKNVVANSKDSNHWKFVVVEEKQKPILQKFIPKEFLEFN